MVICSHSGLYLCGKCGKCYACHHTASLQDDGAFWRCPDGFIKRALPEGHTRGRWWEIDPMMLLVAQ